MPYDVDMLTSSNPETAFNPQLEEVTETSGSFSAVDLSFLPDELSQENKDQAVIRSKHEIEENCKTQSQQTTLPLPSQLDTGLALNSSSGSSSSPASNLWLPTCHTSDSGQRKFSAFKGSWD